MLYLECKQIITRFDINKQGLNKSGLRNYLKETLVQDGVDVDDIKPKILNKRVEVIFESYDLKATGLLELD